MLIYFLQSSFSLRQTCFCERCSFSSKGWSVRSQHSGSSQHFSLGPSLKPLPPRGWASSSHRQPWSPLLALAASLGQQFLSCSPFLSPLMIWFSFPDMFSLDMPVLCSCSLLISTIKTFFLLTLGAGIPPPRLHLPSTNHSAPLFSADKKRIPGSNKISTIAKQMVGPPPQTKWRKPHRTLQVCGEMCKRGQATHTPVLANT